MPTVEPDLEPNQEISQLESNTKDLDGSEPEVFLELLSLLEETSWPTEFEELLIKTYVDFSAERNQLRRYYLLHDLWVSTINKLA